MIVDEIKSILEKNGYDLNFDTISRIETMLNSIQDDNQINKLDYIINWFNKKREESDMVVEEIGINGKTLSSMFYREKFHHHKKDKNEHHNWNTCI